MNRQRVVAGDCDIGRQLGGRPPVAVRWWVAPFVLVLLLAGSCSTPDATATPGGETQPSPDDVDPRLRACIEAAGFDWEQVWPLGSSESPREGSPSVDPPAEAFQECVAQLGLWAEGPFDATRIAEENRAVRAYVACMRDRGWSLADPEPWTGPEHPGLLEPPDLDVPEDTEDVQRLFRDASDCGIPVRQHDDQMRP